MDEPIEFRLEVSPAGVHLLEDLERRTGRSRGEVIRVALALLKAALDARAEGKAVGTAESREWLEAEFVGFWREE